MGTSIFVRSLRHCVSFAAFAMLAMLGLGPSAHAGPPPSCGTSGNDCCVPNGSPGCNDAGCCELVCACDPFCCDVAWDGLCAGNGLDDSGCGAAALCAPCQVTRACCLPNDFCVDLTPLDCVNSGGVVGAPGSDCSTVSCTNPKLLLELAAGSECAQPGEKILVEVWMRDLGDFFAAGFQAFVQFDDTQFVFNPDDSELTDNPFGLAPLPIDLISPNLIAMASGICSNTDLGCPVVQPPTNGDALLATLSFTVITPLADSCEGKFMTFTTGPGDAPSSITDVTFQPPADLRLVDTPPIVIDGTPPVIQCPDDVELECDDDITPTTPFVSEPSRTIGPLGNERTVGQSVHDQGGWRTIAFTGLYDEEVNEDAAFEGVRSWRISNWFHTGLVNPILAPPVAAPAGETGSTTFDGRPAQTGTMAHELWFRSALLVPDEGTLVSLSISDEPGRRMSYLAFRDEGGDFVADASGITTGTNFDTQTSPTLTRGDWYRALVEATFNDGPQNDTVRYRIFDGGGGTVWDVTLGSWEDAYYTGAFGADPGTITASDHVALRVSQNPDDLDTQSPFDSYSVTNQPFGVYIDNFRIMPGLGMPYFTGFEEDVKGVPSVSDNCDDRVALDFSDDFTSDCGSAGTIIRTWTATDDCGNQATCEQEITVADTTPPTITCPADTTIEWVSPFQYPLPSETGEPTGEDNCDGPLTFSFVDGPLVATGTPCAPFTFTRTWNATDDCGNASEPCDQIITIQDTTPPTIVFCPPPANWEWTNPYQPPNENITGSAEATDNCTPNPVITFADGPLQPTGIPCAPFTVSRTWTATDPCGLSSTCKQVITIVDTTPPSILCPSPASVEWGDSTDPTFTGTPTASDNCTPNPVLAYTDGPLTPAGPCPTVFTFVRSWTATDPCGLSSKCEQLITLTDTTPPAITCPADVTIECGESENPLNTGSATATDNCTFDVTYKDDVELTDCTPYVHVITRTWTATDACGLTDSCTQTINVQDTTPPAITCPVDITIECDESIDPSNTGTATAIDDCDSLVSVFLSDLDPVPGSCANEYTITRVWFAIDDCDNFSKCEQIITVNDTTPPVLSAEPGDVKISCFDAVPAAPVITATDNCDLSVSVTFNEVTTPGSCVGEATITRTWSATDDCGNNESHTQEIMINDDVAPDLTCPLDPVELKADLSCVAELPDLTGLVTVTDTPCPSTSPPAPTVVQVPPAGATLALGNTLVTITATDACGNAGSCEISVDVVDNTAPVITCPLDISVNADAGGCDAILDVGLATATDNCSLPEDITITGVRSDGDALSDPYEGPVTITWTATDESGNSDDCIQTVTVSGDNELVVDVQLEGVGGLFNPFTRCITFELFNCDTLATATVQQVLTFDTSGLADDALVLIPCGDWDCITARDPLHTLRHTTVITPSGPQYTASFTGDDALKGGNLNGPASNVIDIFDFGLFAGEFNENYGTGNTDCDDAPPHADISGNGVVFVEDYTFIVGNFLDVSEANCCGLGGIAGGESDTPVLSISVAELVAMGLGSYAAGDLNGDGWLDLVDMQLFADGVWPTDDSEVRKVAFIGAPGSSWFDAGNWSDGLLPDANADVTIDVNVSIDGGDAVAGDIAINSDAVLSVNAASLSTAVITVHGGGMLMLNDPSASVSAQTLVISEGAMLAWNAGLIAADVFNSGLVDLGQPVAQLMLDGEFTQLPAGVLTIDIAGELDSLRDALIITGPANLDGTLEVHLLDEYVPPVGTKLDSVIEAQQITGMFAAVSPPTTLPAGTFQHLAISESAVHIIYSDQPLLPADLNSDGIIGAADLAELLAQWGVCPPPGGCSADFNADGVIDAADLAQILAAWSPE